MQYAEIEIRAQQLVLAFLGFYPGAIDGIWSNSTIAAMKKFEMEDSFLPAIPTGGMPFPANCRLPKGMFWDKRLVSHRKLTKEAMEELLNKRSRSLAKTSGQAEKPAPVADVAPAKTETAKPETVKTESVKTDAQK